MIDEKLEVTREAILAHAPDYLAPVEDEWLTDFNTATMLGRDKAAQSSVVFVGMARSIDGVLPWSIERIQEIGKSFASWHAVVVENDSNDGTKDVLHAWQASDPARVRVTCADYGRPHLHGFERDRVERYAQYRNEGRLMAQEIAPNADYVIVLDLDAWGGYSHLGVLNSICWLERILTAGCMASVSLFEMLDNLGETHLSHYDQWAYRALHSWTPRMEAWFTRWIPPVGSPPLLVKSAFGGLAVYKAAPFYASHYYSEEGDIEHVGLHKSLKANGYDVFLNPSSRVTMQWVIRDDQANS